MDASNSDVNSNELGASNSEVNSSNENKKWSTVLKIPFIGDASYEFKNNVIPLFKQYLNSDVLPVFISCKVSNYFSLKCQAAYPFKSNVVYKFKCLRDADISYIGETTRHLIKRVREHVKTDKKSQVFIHLSKCNTCKNASLGVSNFQILKSCQNSYEVKIHESFLINKLSLNKRLESIGKLIHIIAFN